MEGPSEICSTCGKSPPDTFCICTGLPTIFCNDCYTEHHKQSVGRQHPSYPISILQKCKKDPSYYKILLSRTLSFAEVKAATRERIEVVNSGIARLKKTIQRWADFGYKTVEEMEDEKGRMEASLVEVETTLMDEQPTLSRQYSKIIRDCVERESPKLWLFDYKLNPVEPRSLIDLKNQEYLQYEIPEFPCISGNTLNLCDYRFNQINSLTLSTKFTKGAVFCLLTNSTMLCLGGEPPSALVFQLDLPSRQLRELANTGTPRSYPGIAKVGDFVYVFGSFYPNLATCEKFCITYNFWTNINSNMNIPRNCFAPGVYLEEIFLVSPHQTGNRSIEVFHTKREVFRRLPFELPATVAGYITAFVIEGDLYVLGGIQMAKGKISAEEKMEISAISGANFPLSNCPAFLVGNEVFLVNYKDGALFKFNFASKKVVT